MLDECSDDSEAERGRGPVHSGRLRTTAVDFSKLNIDSLRRFQTVFKIPGELETKEELVHAVTQVFTEMYRGEGEAAGAGARIEPLKDVIRLLRVKKDERGIELRKSARNKAKESVLPPRRQYASLNSKYEFY